MTPTTDTDGLRALLDSPAVARPWSICIGKNRSIVGLAPGKAIANVNYDNGEIEVANAALIVAAVNALPALLDENAALAAKVAEAERERDRFIDALGKFSDMAEDAGARAVAAEADAARFAFFFDCNRMPNLGLGAMLTDDTPYTLDDWRGAIDRAMKPTRDDSEAGNG